MTKKIISEPLAEVIAEYAEDVHLTYSGRGMYGDTCYGFSGDVARIIGDVLQDIADMPDPIRQFGEMLSISRRDNMGLGTILYFPGWSIASDCEIAKLRDKKLLTLNS